jgi:murein DD-endopeptidase MepM/ murein hydrolase activator NlpD
LRKAVIVLPALLAAAVPAPPSSATPSGGVAAPGTPLVTSVRCRPGPEVPCRSPSVLLRGREVLIRGRNLGRTKALVFPARRRRGQVAVRPAEVRERYIVALVPETARGGRLVLIARYGGRIPTQRVAVRDAPPPRPLDIAPGSQYFYAGRRKPTFSFQARRSGEVRVDLLNEDQQALVRTWTVAARRGQTAHVAWDGLGPTGTIEAGGRYRFRLSRGARAAARPVPGSIEGFVFADHLFPIRGRHNLGYTDTNNFGGGRGHKGQDMFARCGTKLAAARGGGVKYAGYHSAAGYYVVIDGDGTGFDYVYMHMRTTPAVRTGQQVFTGQKIGEVGETGRAHGCHLHFEMWSPPGWYAGGQPFDPLPELKRWDLYS